MCSVSLRTRGSNLHFTFLNPKFPNPPKTHCVSFTKTNLLIVDKKIIVTYCMDGKTYTLVTLCVLNEDFYLLFLMG
jgi:hypothetical protein